MPDESAMVDEEDGDGMIPTINAIARIAEQDDAEPRLTYAMKRQMASMGIHTQESWDRWSSLMRRGVKEI